MPHGDLPPAVAVGNLDDIRHVAPPAVPSAVEAGPNANPCAFIGHLFHADLRYNDGVIVGQCAVCGERAHIDHIPGGLLALRAAALIEDLLDPDSDDDELPSRLLDLSEQIDAELAGLKEAAALIGTARAALASRTTRTAAP